jgi:hypothetical protein
LPFLFVLASSLSAIKLDAVMAVDNRQIAWHAYLVSLLTKQILRSGAAERAAFSLPIAIAELPGPGAHSC